MHNNLDFTQPGGLWLTQDILKQMQDAYAPAIDGIANIVGNKAIVAGVNVVNANVSAGWIVYNGELLPFVGGLLAAYVDIETVISQEQYDDQTQKNFNYKKRAVMVSIATATSFLFTDLVRPSQLKNVWLPGDTKAVLCDNAYITANFDAGTGVALPSSERAGWKIAFDMGGRVMVGWTDKNVDPADGVWDLKYNKMQEIGGEKLHQLLVAEMPAHTHDFKRTRTDIVGQLYEADHMKGGSDRGLYTGDSQPTTSAGANVAHNNVQPFKVYLFIEKI